MSEDTNSLIPTPGTSKNFVKSVNINDGNKYKKKNNNNAANNENGVNENRRPLLKRFHSVQSALKPNIEKRGTLLKRFHSVQSALKPNFDKFRSSFRSLSCVKRESDEEMPMMEIPRHKSIDINVGIARRVSLFLFTRRTVCVHPYHPYTPEQTTRKLNFCFEDK